MRNKIAILIDGAFFVQRHRETNTNGPRVDDLKKFITTTIEKVKKTGDAGCIDSLFRIFYYECRPFGDTIKQPDGKLIDYSTTPQFQATTKFLNDLRTFDQLALRLGELSFDGWKTDRAGNTKPDFKQKSVDMKIGLDIAWMSSKRIVDKIVLVTGDSDFVSPMKFARKEGILIYLETMGQKEIKMNLKEHADFLI